jgi:hypothetical protein
MILKNFKLLKIMITINKNLIKNNSKTIIIPHSLNIFNPVNNILQDNLFNNPNGIEITKININNNTVTNKDNKIIITNS